MGEMGAAAFKAQCLKVLERVRRTREEVVVTRRGVPVVRIVPVDVPPPTGRDVFFGFLAGECEIVGDIVSPVYSEAQWQEFDGLRRAQWKEWERSPSPRKRRPRTKR